MYLSCIQLTYLYLQYIQCTPTATHILFPLMIRRYDCHVIGMINSFYNLTYKTNASTKEGTFFVVNESDLNHLAVDKFGLLNYEYNVIIDITKNES